MGGRWEGETGGQRLACSPQSQGSFPLVSTGRSWAKVLLPVCCWTYHCRFLASGGQRKVGVLFSLLYCPRGCGSNLATLTSFGERRKCVPGPFSAAECDL